MGSDGVRTVMGIGMDRGEVMHGGRHGSWSGRAWWFQWGSCVVVPMGFVRELWLISGFAELWLNEHAC